MKINEKIIKFLFLDDILSLGEVSRNFLNTLIFY